MTVLIPRRSQILRPNYGLTNQLVGWWPLIDGQYLDLSGQQNATTQTGSPVFTPGAPTIGTNGGSYYFSTKSNYFSSSTPLFNTLKPPFTMACWFKVKTFTTGNILLWKGYPYAGWYAYYVSVSSTGVAAVEANANVFAVAAQSGTISTGIWYHVAGVFQGSSSRQVYLNGVQVASDTTTLGAWGSTADVMSIGTDQVSGGNTSADQYQNDVRVYNRALSPGEIYALYASTFQPQTIILTDAPITTVKTDYSVSGTTATYAETASTVTPKAVRNVTGASASYADTATSLLFNRGLVLANSSYAETVSTLTGNASRALSLTSSSYADTPSTLTGKTARALGLTSSVYAETPSTLTASTGRNQSLTPASYAETPSTATARVGRSQALTTASYAETQSQLSPQLARRILGTSATYALTDAAATAKAGRLLQAFSGSYALSDSTATFIVTSGASILASTGAYAVTPSSATLRLMARLNVSTAVYALQASSASFGAGGELFTVSGPGVEMRFPDDDVTNPKGDVSFPYKVVRRTA